MIRKIRMLLCILLTLSMTAWVFFALAETEAVASSGEELFENAETADSNNADDNTAEQEAAEMADSGPSAQETNTFFSALKGHVKLFNKEVPVWFLIAACAVLIVLVILLTLIIIREKRKKDVSEAVSGVAEESLNAYITSPEVQGVQILTIGDEPTMDLNSVEGQGVVFGEDEPTTDLKEPEGYIIKVRMVFRDVFLDKELKMTENDQAIIGRSSEAAFQTNPADTSISHRHGVFTAVQGMITYQDESRNGTKYNGQRTLHKDEKITIPLNTKVELEMGEHKILLLAVREF